LQRKMEIIDDKNFDEVVSAIKKIIDFNPDNYKKKPLRRRIWSRMRRFGIDNYEDYTKLLLSDEEEARRLKKALTINLTRFFRNKEVFDYLRKEILPSIKESSIWSAGCANGAEPYSLAILCCELNLPCSILGTDIDQDSIKKARGGIYDNFALQEIDPSLKKRYFKRVKEGFRIADEIKSLVEFQKLDLKDADYKKEFDLIICRNVLIYLSREFQKKILFLFYQALKNHGYLILGKVESLTGDARRLFYCIDIKNRIYEKKV